MHIAAAADQGGIVGASGSGQPLGPRLLASCDVVIANGAECEPLLATDVALMSLAPEIILAGLSEAMGATGASRGRVAIRKSEASALEAMSRAARGMAHVDVVAVPDQYPIGDAHVLVPEVTGRVVPEGGRPEGAGVMVANVHTLWHLARAVDGQVVTWRYVTVGGEVSQPRVLRVPNGMIIADVLELCGGATVPDPVFVLGGPMQGTLTTDAGQALGKAHGGLFVLPAGHRAVEARQMPVAQRLKQAASACAGCRRCSEYCPRGQLGHGLRPHEVIRAVARGDGHGQAVLSAPLCSGCGVCEVVCPAGLSPRSLYQAVEAELSARGYQGGVGQQAPSPAPGRDGRRLPREQVIASMGLGPYSRPPRVEDMDHTPWRLRVATHGAPGVDGEALVKVGERVGFGQPLSRPAGGAGAWTHAPVPGVVMEVSPGAIALRAA